MKKPILLLLLALAAFSCKHERKSEDPQTEVAFHIPLKDFIPEGITYDPSTETFFVGSIYHRKIVKVNPNREVSDFINSGQDGMLEVLGMKVDAPNRHLWVCSAGGVHDGVQNGVAILFKYDLDKNVLLKKYALDNKKSKHLFNDLAIASNGDVYVTDSETGAIWKRNATTDALEKWLPDSTFDYPNGIVLSPGELFLLVAEEKGLKRVILKDKSIQPLTKEGENLGGIDGMSWYRDGVVAVQNGVKPARVIYLQLNADHSNVESLIELEKGHPMFHIPTTGTVAYDEYFVIANSLLDVLNDQGEIADTSRLQEVTVLRIPIITEN